MKLDDLTTEEAKQHLANTIRDHVRKYPTGVFRSFHPFDKIELMYVDNMLGRINPATPYTGRTFIALVESEQLMGMNDNQIWQAIMKGQEQ